jgi:glycosyltransferase involved in cell wall biosynthesis
MKKIKVVNIITKLELGGAQKVALYSANNLGDEFESYFISGEKGLLDKKKFENYKNIKKFYNVLAMKRNINIIEDFIALSKLFFLIKKIKPKIVHTHSSKAGILGRWAAFFAKVPTIIHTYHGFGFHTHQNFLVKNFFIFIEKITSLITNEFIVVSHHNLETALQKKIGKEKQYHIIRCGIDIKKYRDNKVNVKLKKQELGIPENHKVIGMIGCFKQQKAPLDFIKIAKELLKKRKDLFFVMIGDGELRDKIQKNIEKSKIDDKIKLLGWRDDVKDILKLWDVSVLTSLWEGLPMSILESMAAGVPVVATMVDGTQEMIDSAYNGFLIECHNIDRFISKINILLNNKNIRDKFIKNSNLVLTGEFDKAKVIENIKNLYKK